MNLNSIDASANLINTNSSSLEENRPLSDLETRTEGAALSAIEEANKPQQANPTSRKRTFEISDLSVLLFNLKSEKKAFELLQNSYNTVCNNYNIAPAATALEIQNAKASIKGLEDEIIEAYSQDSSQYTLAQQNYCEAILSKRAVEAENFRVLSPEEVKIAIKEQRSRNLQISPLYNTEDSNLAVEDSSSFITKSFEQKGDWTPGSKYFEFKESENLLDEKYPVYFCESIGNRDGMEDAHLATTITVHGKNYPLLGVFDGHGGKRLAEYLQKNLPSKLTQKLEEYSNGSTELTECCIYNALKLSLVELDDEYLISTDGSTAIVSFIVNGKVYTASVGDSRAILIKPSLKIYAPLSTDAKINAPNDLKDNKHREILEKKRSPIFEYFGIYRVGPLQHAISMGSAVGDHISGENCTVEISAVPIPEEDVYLLLACDGLWDWCNPGNAKDYIVNHLGNLQETVRSLTYHSYSYSKGYSDNISVLLCKIPRAT